MREKKIERIRKKVALYFGTFNPLHYGHLAVAEYVIRNIELDEFRFVLSPHNPFKSEELLLGANDRLQSLKKAIRKFNQTLAKTLSETSNTNSESKSQSKSSALKSSQCTKVIVSDIEFSLPEPRYTFNTLTELEKREKGCDFILVVGADSFAAMERWYKGVEILRKYKIIIYPRKGYRVKTKATKYHALYLENAPLNIISSTQIREGKV